MDSAAQCRPLCFLCRGSAVLNTVVLSNILSAFKASVFKRIPCYLGIFFN